MSFRTLDLNLLRVFDQIMAEQNLTRAASRLAMTQPTVSNALRRLRQALGDELFTRTAFGVKPTPKAEALWPEVRAALDRLREAIEPGSFEPRQHEATFRIVAADATATKLMPALIARIEQAEALTNLRTLPLTTRDPSALLERGEADFAIGYFPEAVAILASQGSQAALHHERMYEAEYACVMRKDHPLASQVLTLDAFCAARHLQVSFSGRAQGLVDHALTAVGRSRRVMLTVNQFFTAGRVVAHSDLLTVLPSEFLPSTGMMGELVMKPIPLALPPVHVELLWHRRHERNPAHAWMREQIMAAGATRDLPWPALA